MQCSRQESCSRVFTLAFTFKAPGLFMRCCCVTLFSVSPHHPEVLAPVQSRTSSLNVFGSSGALTFGYGCTVYVGVDVGAGYVGVDVIYVSFIVSVQNIGYLVPYKWTTEPPCTLLDRII